MTRRPATVQRSMLIAAALAPAAALAQPCGDWSMVPTPSIGTSVTRLTSVAARSPEEAWAVGLWRNTSVGAGPLIVRWDGAAWGQVEMPATAHLGTMPQTVGAAIAPNDDAWVVGYVTTTYPTYNMPLLMRRRAGSWDIVSTAALRPQTVYPFAARGGLLSAAAALAPDDVWAVGLGGGYGDGGATAVPLAVHWDGSSWTAFEVPRVANRHHDLVAIAAIATDDVWAVGEYRNIAGAYRGITYHWNGTNWSHVPSPIENIPGSGLIDITATASDEVWAIGTGDSAVVLMRWNGSQWSLMQPPPNTGGSILATGPDDLWASGWDGYWHWNGSAWTAVPASVPGSEYVIRSGGMQMVGNCDIWTVGFWQRPDGVTFSLAERLGSSACPANCDGSSAPPILNVDDFTCFINHFAAASALPHAQQLGHYANCDNSTTPPVLNVDDFTCFINQFAAGCP
jgi:hypothetical protein